MEEALYLCRFVQFTAAVVVFGASAFRFYALGGDAFAAGVVAEFDCWSGRVARVSAFLALVSALALLLFQAASMTGSLAAAIDPATVAAVLFHTRFGRVWCWHLLFAIFLVLACLGRPRRRHPVILTLSLLLLA